MSNANSIDTDLTARKERSDQDIDDCVYFVCNNSDNTRFYRARTDAKDLKIRLSPRATRSGLNEFFGP